MRHADKLVKRAERKAPNPYAAGLVSASGTAGGMLVVDAVGAAGAGQLPGPVARMLDARGVDRAFDACSWCTFGAFVNVRLPAGDGPLVLEAVMRAMPGYSDTISKYVSWQLDLDKQPHERIFADSWMEHVFHPAVCGGLQPRPEHLAQLRDVFQPSWERATAAYVDLMDRHFPSGPHNASRRPGGPGPAPSG